MCYTVQSNDEIFDDSRKAATQHTHAQLPPIQHDQGIARSQQTGAFSVRSLSPLVHRSSLSSDRLAETVIPAGDELRLPVVHLHSGRMQQLLCLRSITRGRIRRSCKVLTS